MRRILSLIALSAILLGSSVSAVNPTSASAASSINGRGCGVPQEGRLIPTIDDWPYETADLFRQFDDKLEHHGVKSIQFILTDERFTSRFPRFQSYTLGRGHHVGGHSVTHRDLKTLSTAALNTEIARSAGGNLFRSPGGSHGTRENRAIVAHGKRECDWDIDSGDTSRAFDRLVRAGNRQGAINLLRTNVRNGLRANPNAKIILFHYKSISLSALDYIIPDARAAGFKWCRIGTKPASLNLGSTIPC